MLSVFFLHPDLLIKCLVWSYYIASPVLFILPFFFFNLTERVNCLPLCQLACLLQEAIIGLLYVMILMHK